MANSKEYMRVYMLRRYHERRNEAIAALGGTCVVCGSTEKLEFDHVDRESKSFSIAKLLSGCPRERFLREIAKCQLLCDPCHTKKTLSERGYHLAKGKDVHGTLSAYRYCGPPKCDRCRAAKNLYCRDWKKGLRGRNINGR